MKNAKNRLISILILLILSFVGLMPNNSINNTYVDSTIHEKSTPTLSNLYKILGHTYDFEDEIEGQDPTGETLSTNEATGCTANIENLADGQQKHLSLHKVGSTGRVWVRDNFSHFGETYTAGEYHVKVYHDNSGFGINLNSANGEAILAMVWWNGEIRDDVGGTFLSTYTLNQWIDVIIYFNLTLGWMFDLDGVRYGAGYSFSFFGPFTANAEHIWMTSFIGGGGDGYFRVDDISYFYENDNLINILSPVNNTYTKTMTGYYPATYGFEDQPDVATEPDGWINNDGTSCTTSIMGDLGGHKKVVKQSDGMNGAKAQIDNGFASQDHGTIELYARYSVDSDHSAHMVILSSSTVLFQVWLQDSYWKYYDSIGGHWLYSESALEDMWYHVSIRFRGSFASSYDGLNNYEFNVYVNGIQIVSGASFTNTMDVDGLRLETDNQDTNYEVYWDAVGYSWDPNYNIGENMEEGLLVSFDTGLPLHTMSYSLDNQLKKSILGDTVIPMPENGLHAIQIFGIDQYETKYQSNIRYFTIDFPINIITPEARGYNEPMSGYYPATYGFESDLPGGDAKNWTHDDVSNTHSYLIDSYKGHERVYELYDNHGTGNPDTYNSYVTQSNGTIELWVLVKITGFVIWIELFYDLSPILTVILKTGEYLIAKNNTVNVNMTEFGIINEDQWYHLRIDFRSALAGPYLGLADDSFRVYLNDTQCDSDLIMNAPSSQVNKIRITTGNSLADPNYYSYFDAVGYSWDPLYNIGDNRYEGLLLSYTNNTNLDWVGYSLDSQPNRTIFGNTSISFPEDGRHSIRVYGNNSLGTQFQSTTRYFSTHHITIITPEDKLYTGPMSGYYPGTYGFENDIPGSEPSGWYLEPPSGSSYYQIASEYQGHKNVFEMRKIGGTHLSSGRKNFSSSSTAGTVEFWLCKDTEDLNDATRFYLFNSTGGRLLTFFIEDSHLYYDEWGERQLLESNAVSKDKWYHFRVDFNVSLGGWQLQLNDTWYGSGYALPFKTNAKEASQFEMASIYSSDYPNYAAFLDAFGFSWDPDYNVGDNLNEGLLLSYENNTNLAWQGYSLNGQSTKTILGNTTIPMLDGTHFIQVIGNDSSGNIYRSDERYFTVNTGSFFDIKTPENKTYYGPMLESFPATFGFENDEDQSNPNGWTVVETGGSVNVISDIDGHSKVVEINDFSSSYMVELYRNFADQTAGTIELYLRCGDNTKRTNVFIYDGIDTKSAYLFFDNNGWIRYWDTATRDIMTYNKDQWYHLKIEWNCTVGEWHLWIDGIKTQYAGYDFYGTPSAMDTIHFSTTGSELNFYSYIDAVSYSWDPNYNIGDNVYDGTLLGFNKNTELNWLGYSLNGQYNKTFFGNMTIPFMNLNEGLNSIQLFGEDCRGIVYESEIRYFTVSYAIDIITPEEKIYNAPMNGYYPATYGFENDDNNEVPEEWSSWVSGGNAQAKVISTMDEYNKVVELNDITAGGQTSFRQPFNENQTFGTIEFWFYITDITQRTRVNTQELGIGTAFEMFIESSKWQYYVAGTPFDVPNVATPLNNKWAHIRIDFECGTGGYQGLNEDEWYIIIDGVNSTALLATYARNNINWIDFISAVAASNYYFYIDAIGYSWDPNYNIGDNLNEGLLLSYENSTNLDWQGYSLDAQSTKTILGNTTIPMPFYGEHIIRVLGNDSLGEFYQSRLRHFEVSSINITTPENMTYIDPMSGYYPATYGFENEPTGAIDENIAFIDYGPSSSIILEELDGHNKILQIYRVGWAATQSYFAPTFEGTVEMWIRVDDSNADQIIAIGESDGPKPSIDRPTVKLTVDNGNIYWSSNATEYNLISAFSSDLWYHLRIDVFSNNSFDVYLNQNLMVSKAQTMYNMTTGMNCTHFKEYDGAAKWYVDAVGYSWDPGYNIGDNLYEGLLLSYENRTNLDWQGYSLNSQPTETILGNTTIPMPENGLHGIQIFGNDELGLVHYSPVRYFTIQYFPIDIITPENQTYTEPMSGYYPATYGFENDTIFSYPSGWTSIETGGTIQVSSDFNGHHKVVKLNDTIGAGNDLRNNFNDKTEGVIEFWMGTNNIIELNEIDIWDDDDLNWGVQLSIYSSKFQYKQSDNNWYDIPNVGTPLNNSLHHWSVIFNCSTYTFHVLIDGIDSGVLFFKNNHTNFDRFQFHTSDTGSGFSMYVDAIGYSWDPNYNVGDNRYEGLLLSYENGIIFDWEGYLLDGQSTKTIEGNTTIPIPSNGIHTIKVFGNNTFGNMFYSDIRYFTIDYTTIDIITPGNITYAEPMSGYYPGTYGFENDDVGSFPDDWDVGLPLGLCTISVISELDNHKNVLDFNDPTSSNHAQISQNFSSPQTNGTFEMWIRITDANDWFIIFLGNSSVYGQFGIMIMDGKWQYSVLGVQWAVIPGLADPQSNTWYHLRLDFECSNSGYMGLTKYYYKLIVDGISSDPLLMKYFSPDFTRIYLRTSMSKDLYHVYIDALGYSWDPNYIIGDNLNEGLLLSYENSTNLDWQGYSLDAQSTKTIKGNTTIPLPLNGTHTIQVFGNTSVGVMYQSEVRYFTVNISTILDIIDPIIFINSPLLYDLFGSAGPSFNITIIELNLHSTWYTLDGGFTNIPITEPTGNIDQPEWDKIGNGTANIKFYANDTAGNLGFEEVTVRKDILPPEIIIYSPIYNDLIGSSAPTFDLDINDPNLATRWYSLDGGTATFPILGSTGIINQALWNAQPEGIITIMFYAEDSVGNFGFEEVAVRKDTLPPDIVIIFPSNNNAFTDTAPTFELTIIEDNLNEIWYTLSDGLVNITCITLGQINQDYWNALPPGTYTLRFYANDLLGNEGFTDVVIIKTEPTIPGFNPILLSFIILIGIPSIAWQIKKKLNLKGGFS